MAHSNVIEGTTVSVPFARGVGRLTRNVALRTTRNALVFFAEVTAFYPAGRFNHFHDSAALA